jgi:hypothetical protein
MPYVPTSPGSIHSLPSFPTSLVRPDTVVPHTGQAASKFPPKPSVRASKTLTPVLWPLWDEAFRPCDTRFHPMCLLRPPKVSHATTQGDSCDHPGWILRPPRGSFNHPRWLLRPLEVAPSTTRGGSFDRPRWLLRPLEMVNPSSSSLVGW